MKTRSAKNKGKKFQNLIRDKFLDLFPELEPDDCRSTTMGMQGEDLQLSPAARKLIPYSIECKSNKRFAVYKILEQAKTHGAYTPLVFLKQDRSDPLVVIELSEFLELLKDATDKRK